MDPNNNNQPNANPPQPVQNQAPTVANGQQVNPAIPQSPQPVNQQAAVTMQAWPGITLNSNAFGPKKINVTILPGMLIISDFATNQEQYRIQLRPDMKIVKLFGGAQIQYMNGQKITGEVITKYTFNFFNPMINPMFSVWGGSWSKAKKFIELVKQAAGVAN